jgi:drug/metabolite transporter (DMT)-like permease
MQPDRRLRADLALISVTFFWGSTFTLVKSALEDASVLAFLAVRFSFAALLLAVIYRDRLALAGWAAWRGGIAAGLCLLAGYYLQTGGLRHTTPSKSAFLTSLCVVMVPLLAAAVYRVVPAAGEAAGATMAVSGAALMTLESGAGGINRGDWMTIGAALGFALHILVVGRVAPRFGHEVLSVCQVATVAAGTALTCWWVEPLFWRTTPRLAAAVVITGVLCTALGFTVQAAAQRHTTPARTALIFALEPVFAAATSWAVLGEAFSACAYAGAALILAGVLASELKPGARAGHLSK